MGKSEDGTHICFYLHVAGLARLLAENKKGTMHQLYCSLLVSN